MVNPRKSKPSPRWTMRVLSSLKARPRGASHSASRALTCSACSWVWQSTTTSSAYLTATGDSGMRFPACVPVARYRTPASSSSPCNATFSRQGLITPPTQWITRAHVTLRVVADVFLAASGGRFPGGDAVPDGDLLGSDKDVFDQQAQHSLPLADAGVGGVAAQL